jgi:hypothetical protein
MEVKIETGELPYKGRDMKPQPRKVYCPKCGMVVEYDASLFDGWRLPCGH